MVPAFAQGSGAQPLIVQFPETDGVLLCPVWADFVWQKHGFGTRHRAPFPALTLRQIHSNEVRVAAGLSDREFEGDALVTAQREQAIGVRTADCVPILLLDPRTHAVAAVHAGWRGTAAGIVTKALRKLEAEFGSHAEDLEAAIGPSIRVCCYEVSPEVASQFSREVVREGSGARPHLDLVAANMEQMMAAGVGRERIYDCELCTYCHPELFFSYRRDAADPRRMTSAICRLD